MELDGAKRPTRKRTCGTPPSDKKQIKQHGKENSTATSVSSAATSSLSSEASSSRTMSLDFDEPISCRTLWKAEAKPEKLVRPVNNLKTIDSPGELITSLKQSCAQNPVGCFLPRNVIQKKKICNFAAIAHIREVHENKKAHLEEVVDMISYHGNQKVHSPLLSFHMLHCKCWGHDSEWDLPQTSSTIVQCSLTVVHKDGSVRVDPIGPAIVPLIGSNSNQTKESIMSIKNVSIPKSTSKKVTKVFLVVETTRWISQDKIKLKTQKNLKGRLRNNADVDNYCIETRRGAFLFMDSSKFIDERNNGIREIILTDINDSELKRTYSKPSTSRNIDWKGNLSTLKYLHNLNEIIYDCQLPRLSLNTAFSTIKQDEEPDQDKRDVQKPVRCPIRDINFVSMSHFIDNANARFPCFKFAPSQKGVMELSLDVDYFDEKGVSRDTNFVRRNNYRCFPKVPAVPGLNSVLPVYYHQMHLRTTRPFPDMGLKAKPSTKTLKAPKKTNRCTDHIFFVENGKMMFEHNIYDHWRWGKKEERFHKNEFNPNREMQVVIDPVSRDETIEYNRKLALAAEGKLNLPRAKQVLSAEGEATSKNVVKNGVDFEGNQMPAFSELVFPTDKKGIYDMYYTYYLGEHGVRTGAFNAESRARIILGFLQKYHQEIFNFGLKDIYLKNVQAISMVSIDWTSELTHKILQEFRTLYDKWEEDKKTRVADVAEDAPKEGDVEKIKTRE